MIIIIIKKTRLNFLVLRSAAAVTKTSPSPAQLCWHEALRNLYIRITSHDSWPRVLFLSSSHGSCADMPITPSQSRSGELEDMQEAALLSSLVEDRPQGSELWTRYSIGKALNLNLNLKVNPGVLVLWIFTWEIRQRR